MVSLPHADKSHIGNGVITLIRSFRIRVSHAIDARDFDNRFRQRLNEFSSAMM